ERRRIEQAAAAARVGLRPGERLVAGRAARRLELRQREPAGVAHGALPQPLDRPDPARETARGEEEARRAARERGDPLCPQRLRGGLRTTRKAARLYPLEAGRVRVGRTDSDTRVGADGEVTCRPGSDGCSAESRRARWPRPLARRCSASAPPTDRSTTSATA